MTGTKESNVYLASKTRYEILTFSVANLVQAVFCKYQPYLHIVCFSLQKITFPRTRFFASSYLLKICLILGVKLRIIDNSLFFCPQY